MPSKVKQSEKTEEWRAQVKAEKRRRQKLARRERDSEKAKAEQEEAEKEKAKKAKADSAGPSEPSQPLQQSEPSQPSQPLQQSEPEPSHPSQPSRPSKSPTDEDDTLKARLEMVEASAWADELFAAEERKRLLEKLDAQEKLLAAERRNSERQQLQIDLLARQAENQYHAHEKLKHESEKQQQTILGHEQAQQQLRHQHETLKMQHFQQVHGQNLDMHAAKAKFHEELASQEAKIKSLRADLEAEKYASKQSDRREQTRWIDEVGRVMALELQNKKLIEDKRKAEKELEAERKKRGRSSSN